MTDINVDLDGIIGDDITKLPYTREEYKRLMTAAIRADREGRDSKVRVVLKDILHDMESYGRVCRDKTLSGIQTLLDEMKP